MSLLMLLSIMSFQETKTVFIDRVAIKVNDKIITERELLNNYQQRRQEALNNFTGAELDKKLKDAWKDTVSNAEETLLMYEKAVELGYAYSREDTMARLNSLKESNGYSDEEFEQMLAEQTGMTLDELVDLRTRDDSAQGVFQSQVLQRIKIEDNEIAKYYDENISEFMKDATYRISEIVLIKDEAAPGAAREKAEMIMKELRSGQDFAEMAKLHSDSLSKENGGDLGLVKFGDLLGTIEDQVRAMEVGNYSEILESSTALFIIKLTERNPESPKPIDEVREDIVNKLRAPRTETQLEKFLEELRAEYSVKVYTPEIPWYLE